MDKIKIDIPNEKFKGDIIGREARNIRTFQQETGIKVVIDDTPNAIFLEGQDERKMETAKRVMENLIRDGVVKIDKIREYKKLYS